MATLEFQVLDPRGATDRRRVTAEDVPAAVQELRQAGLRPVSFCEAKTDRLRSVRVPEVQLTTFYRSLAAALNEGVPLVEALSFIGRESKSPRLQTVVADLVRQTNRGVPLARAMADWPLTFSEADRALVAAGEKSGPLPAALALLADHRETAATLSRRLAVALVYPAVIATVIWLLMTAFMIGILPRMLSLFTELGLGADKLPLLTLAIAWLGAHWWRVFGWLLAAAVTLTGLLRVLARSATGRLAQDRTWLRVPLLGAVIYHASLQRVCGLMGVLLTRRLPLLQSLRLAAASAGNAVVGGAFRRAAERVSEGQRLSVALRETEALPEGLLWRVAVAESAGDMADAFTQSAAAHEADVDLRLRAFTALVEPLLLIVLGVFVGAVIVGLFSPFVAIVRFLSGG